MADTPSPKDPSYYQALQRLQLDQWARDQNDGITTRAVYSMLREHIGKDEDFQADVGERVAKLEAGAARDAEDRQGDAFAQAVEAGTGRYHIPGPFPLPPPPGSPTPVAVTVNTSAQSHRPKSDRETRNIFSDEMKKSIAKTVPIVVMILLSSLFGYLAKHLQTLASEPTPVAPTHVEAK